MSLKSILRVLVAAALGAVLALIVANVVLPLGRITSIETWFGMLAGAVLTGYLQIRREKRERS